MNRFLAAVLLAALSFAASAATVYTAPYGVQNEFEFEIWSTDGLSLDVDETDSGTDVTLRCNDNAEATATNDYTDEGTTYRIVLTATEMQCELVTVTVNEAVDAVFHIQTVDNASARLPQQNANVTQFGGTNGTFSGGRPEVNTTHAAGTAWNSGAIGANTLAADTITAAKAAADLTTELQTGLATSSALTTVGTNVSTLLEALVVLGAEQTADSGTTTTLVDAALTQGTDGWFNGMAVHFTSGTLLGQASCATGFTASSDTLTFSPAVTTAVTTHTYYLLPDAECVTGDAYGRVGAPAGASLAADVADVRADIPTALVSGRMDVSVGAYETGLTPLQPTVAGRTIDVTTGGNAGIDFDNIALTNGAGAAGISASGTLSGTHSSTTADLGTNAPGATSQLAGMTLFIPAKHFSATISSYNTGTGVATFAPATSLTLADGDAWLVIGTPSTSFAADSITASVLAADAGTELATATWASTTRLLTAGTNIVLAKGTGITGFNDLSGAQVQTEAEDAINVRLEQATRTDAAIVNCEVNTANFAGSTTTVACILTDRDAGAITAASNDLEGRELLVLSGAQIYEGRFITDSTWDGANSELRLTLSRALPGTLADAVTAIIR